MNERLRVGVLASGGGSNLQAILDASHSGWLAAQVVVVISDQAEARALDRARAAGAAAVHVPVPRTGTPQWEAANDHMVNLLQEHRVQLVAMAGYMRKVSPRLLQAFPGAVMNIHPALLPSFPGTHGARDAHAYGVKLAGVTVHFADEEFDRGPIIIQGAVPVLDGDTPESLAARILEVEHRVYPQAIQWFAQGRLRVAGRRVILEGEPTPAGDCLVWPPLERHETGG